MSRKWMAGLAVVGALLCFAGSTYARQSRAMLPLDVRKIDSVVARFDQPTTPPTTGQVPIQQLPGTAPAAPASGPTQSAVPVKEVPSPAAPSHALDQALWALAVSYVLKKLMQWKWFTWLGMADSSQVKAAWGFAAAVLTAAGIHFVVTGSVLDGGLNITVTGVSLDAIKDIGWQWVSQQAWYDAVVKESAVGG
jgi:hypothetical protein